jgi:hypothetical protein
MEKIKNELKSYLENAGEPIQQVLITQDEHPVWSDNLKIMQLAWQQIAQPLGILPDEYFLAFIGVHAKAVVGKRNSIGFLVTNFRILMQTDFSIVGTAEKARIYPFVQRQTPQEVSGKVWNDFFIKNTMSVEQEMLSAMRSALEAVVGIVLPRLQGMNHLPGEIKKSTNVSDRIKELGLQDVLKNYGQEEKRLRKFAEKYNVPGIIFGTVDKPLFGGVYGLVITRSGITSRDVMEDSMTSSWDEIRQHPATTGDANDAIRAGLKTHIVPMFQKEYTPSIVVLINELATGEVMI